MDQFWRRKRFGNVMSCTLSDENFSIKLFEFRSQIWLQSRNLLKIGRVYKEFSNNSEISSNLLGHILLFWKVMMPAIHKIPKILCTTTFKNVSGELNCKGSTDSPSKNGLSQKRLIRFFKKIPILECGKCPIKPLILSFCVEFNFINSL